jgi:hypothetical protein
MMLTIRPSSTEKVILLTAVKPPKRFTTFVVLSKDMVAAAYSLSSTNSRLRRSAGIKPEGRKIIITIRMIPKTSFCYFAGSN